jgi:hypothetical protein
VLEMRAAIMSMLPALARLEDQGTLESIQDDLCRAAHRVAFGYEWQAADLKRAPTLKKREPLPIEKQIRDAVVYVKEVFIQSRPSIIGWILTFAAAVLAAMYAKK